MRVYGLTKSRIGRAFLLAVGLFAGTVFIIFSVRNSIQISPEEAEVYTGSLKEVHFSTGRSGRNVNYIELTNGCKYDVRPGTVSENELEEISEGAEMKLIVNPNNGYALEIYADGIRLNDFDSSQLFLRREAVLFFLFGIFMIATPSAICITAYCKKHSTRFMRRTKYKRTTRWPVR